MIDASAMSEQQAIGFDQRDPLRELRNHFYIPQHTIYLDGNSLGLMSTEATKTLQRAVDEWADLAISGWLQGRTPWFYYAEELGKLEAPLVGAEPDEVVVHATTTINLHLLLATFFQPTPERNKILIDALAFPSDRYAIASQLGSRGMDLATHIVMAPAYDGRTILEEDIIAALTPGVAVAILPSVLFRSGQLLNMKQITHQAHEHGILIGFDCSHSIGVVPHELHTWDVDFAFWCNYKYVNGGPGAPASLYIHQRHLQLNRTPALAGWWGSAKDRQFDLGETFIPMPSAGAWQVGTPHILSLAALEGALGLLRSVDLHKIREKSVQLTEYFINLVDTFLATHNFFVATPREAKHRGAHVALEHPLAASINEALKNRGVRTDFRPPHTIRFAFAPLYTSFQDVWRAVEILREIMEREEYKKYQNRRALVA